MEADHCTLYDTASECSDNIYVLARGHPHKPPRKSRLTDDFMYETASESSENVYVLARGHPRKPPRNPCEPPIPISNSTYIYMDRFLDYCVEFQVRFAAFKIKMENAMKAQKVKAAAPVMLPKPASNSKSHRMSIKRRVKKLLLGCFISSTKD